MTGECRFTLKSHSETVHVITFSPDGSRLASGGADQFIKMWDPVEGVFLWTIENLGYGVMVGCVAFSPDNLLLASAHHDGVINLQDAANGRLKQELFISNNHEFTCVAF
jgi:WD40 repeat protein